MPCFFAYEAEKINEEYGGLYTVGSKIDLKTPPLPYKDHYLCSFFDPCKNTCRIYQGRPFDCQLYPFMITYGADFKSVFLVLDTKCPSLRQRCDSKEVKEYLEYLTDILEREQTAEYINENKLFVNDFQDDSIILKKLDKITKRLCLNKHRLRKISLKDKAIFDEYFTKNSVSLSCFSFPAIYIWSGILNILWTEINNALGVFAGNDRDYFLLLPPVDENFDETAVKKSFEILSDLNNGCADRIRIENVPQKLCHSIAALGLKLEMTSYEYIYNQKDLSTLKDAKYKSKRASINNFVGNYKHNCRVFEEKDIFTCLDLYREWARQRLEKKRDDYYRFLIEDSYSSHKIALMNFKALGLGGYVVEVEGKIQAYTLGYRLNREVYVILFEIANLNLKGISQFIFREFCRGLNGYKFINTLGHSGLENLKRVKDSYHPIKKEAVFTARKQP